MRLFKHLFASVYLASAHHNSCFGSARCCLIYATGWKSQVTFCVAVFASVLHVHAAHTVHIVEKCYFGRKH
jgi:hypothetical protein